MEKASDIVLFFGRFHPLVVHLPIGFLILAIFMEFVSRSPKFKHLKPSIRLIWLLGTLSGAVAALFGYLLSLEGSYTGDTLLWHQWAGIATTILAFICYLTTDKPRTANRIGRKRVHMLFVGLTLLLLTFTGHYGANLTHGAGYLTEYAPQPIRSALSLPSKNNFRKEITSLDSANLFEDAVKPILVSRCVSCHNPEKIKGRLILSDYDNILKGGKSGAGIVAGNVSRSELFRRISLPKEHEDFMPPEGKSPLSEQQIEIIKWWIEQEAPKQATISSLNPDAETEKLFNDLFGIGKDNFIQNGAPPIDRKSIEQLQNQGVIVSLLAEEGNFLEANFSISETPDSVNLSDLLLIKDQLIWLQLAKSNINDQDLEVIGKLTNLRKLNLSQNSITDQGVSQLVSLKNLQQLNLYGNQITEKSIGTLKQLDKLKKLFLWQTGISPESIERLKAEKPELMVIYDSPTIQ